LLRQLFALNPELLSLSVVVCSLRTQDADA